MTKRYTPFDLTLAAVCALLCGLGVACVASGGAGAASGLGACAVSGLVLFGLFLATLGWWPARGLSALVKAIAFACLWLLQLGMLGAVEGGSFPHTLLSAGGLPLAAWLLVLVLSLPSVGGALLLSLNRLS